MSGCCDDSRIRHHSSHLVKCSSCGFTWELKFPSKNAKRQRWVPKWYCEDSYQHAWRRHDFTKHEVVGTRRIGKKVYYMVGCGKTGLLLRVPQSSEEVFCPDCDRTGLIGPLLLRREKRDDTLPPAKWVEKPALPRLVKHEG